MIDAILVDDEGHARDKLSGLLGEFKEIEVKAICKNGLEAINQINNHCPDLVFLDIEMPEIDGFRVVSNIECDPLPYIVFVTAFNEYAVKAFEVEALDYINKPFDKHRLQKSIDRYKKITEQQDELKEYEQKIKSILKNVGSEKMLDRFIVKKRETYFFLNADDVLWIESDGNYLRIITEGDKYLIRHTLKRFEDYLDDNQYYRISRSVIVNIDCVKSIQKHLYGNYMVLMTNGKSLKMSKSYRLLLEDFKNF
jgi:two-component system LytT family response regulator